MSTVAYIRVSTARQADSGLGLEAQISRIQQFSQLNNIEIAETIVDAGISGRTMNRDGLQQLLSGVAEGRFTRVIVSSADRLTRSCRDFQTLVNGPLRDVELIAAHMVTSLTEDVEFAEREAEEHGRRTSEAMQVKRARGEAIGKAPYGRRWEGGSLVDDAEEIKKLLLIRNLRLSGLTFRAIAAELEARGVINRKGRAVWSLSALKMICEGVDRLKAHVELAEIESMENSRRTSEALSVLKAQGMRVGNLPLGQTVTESGELMANEAEQQVINKVRAKRAEGTALDALVEWCQQEGITARSGLTPSRTTIAKWIEGVELTAPVKRKPMPPRKPRQKLEETSSCRGLTALVRDLHRQGLSLRAIAAEVSQRGYLNSKGNAFHAQNIKRIIDRLEKADHAERR